jgi:hypothetical protein
MHMYTWYHPIPSHPGSRATQYPKNIQQQPTCGSVPLKSLMYPSTSASSSAAPLTAPDAMALLEEEEEEDEGRSASRS